MRTGELRAPPSRLDMVLWPRLTRLCKGPQSLLLAGFLDSQTSLSPARRRRELGRGRRGTGSLGTLGIAGWDPRCAGGMADAWLINSWQR